MVGVFVVCFAFGVWALLCFVLVLVCFLLGL